MEHLRVMAFVMHIIKGTPTRFDERNWGSRLVKLDT